MLKGEQKLAGQSRGRSCVPEERWLVDECQELQGRWVMYRVPEEARRSLGLEG